MQIVELSNHPRALLAKAAAPRLAAEAQAERKWEQATAGREQRVERLREERARARSPLRPGRWLLASLKLARLAVSVAPPAPRPIAPSDDERAKAAGIEGEDGVLLELSERLDDDWRALSGYRNRGGEIDLVLVGPRGVFAIEIKNNNAVIACEGNAWFYKKYDKYDNLVGEGTIQDRKGRSPSQQLNDPADLLVPVLAPVVSVPWVTRIVVLCHPRGWVDFGRSYDLTVAVANNTRGLIELIGESEAQFGPEEIAGVAEAIVADHGQHNRGSARRR